MIAFMKGTVAQIGENQIILELNQIGYQIFMPAGSLSSELREGTEVKVYTYLYVKEDLLQLYGFLSKDDLEVFRLLLGVNGIGPKGAMGILSTLNADDLRFAVLADDAAAISRSPGIGKKTAQKLILELKDKLKLDEVFEQKRTHLQEHPGVQGASDAAAEAVQALTALGYSGTEAMRSVRKVQDPESKSTEVILKEALKLIES